MAPSSSTYGSAATSGSRPASPKSPHMSNAAPSSSRDSEVTPLLSRDVDDAEQNHEEDRRQRAQGESNAASSLMRSLLRVGSTKDKSQRRWPSFVALVLLCLAVVFILFFGFFAPRVLQEYAEHASTLRPDRLSIESITDTGLEARVQGEFYMDATKVEKSFVRRFGRLATWVARKAATGKTKVVVRLPSYGDQAVGTANLPPITVDIRNNRRTQLDVLCQVEPGSSQILTDVAKDWMKGKVHILDIEGSAKLAISSGIIHLSEQELSRVIQFKSGDTPKLQYNITHLNVHESEKEGDGKALAADVSISIVNDFPLELVIPPVAFDVLVDNCEPSDSQLGLARAKTQSIAIKAREPIIIQASSVVSHLAKSLTDVCPDSDDSPLDALISEYVDGNGTTVYVGGSRLPSSDTPAWIGEILSSVSVPIELPGHSFGDLIKKFSFNDTQLSLPKPYAKPGSPEASPTISTKAEILVNIPDGIDATIDVKHVRPHAIVFYKGDEVGVLDIKKWQKASSTRLELSPDGPGLQINAEIEKAPFRITNDSVFSNVVSKVLFGSGTVYLQIQAQVDVQFESALGELTVRRIPAEAEVPVEPIGQGGGLDSFQPQISNLSVISTTSNSIKLSTLVNMTNPTNYSATVPYADLLIMVNKTIVGHATVENVTIRPGVNHGIPVTGVWQPAETGGDEGEKVGLDAISQYLSGFNVTLAVRSHAQTIPAQPAIGKALSALKLEFLAPHTRAPRDPDDGSGDDGDDNDKTAKFIEYTEMHLISSTAVFHLFSPLSSSSVYITNLNATASYRNETVGNILHEYPFEVPPGRSTTPRLPVNWSVGSVGYDAVRKALGGQLKVDAKADVGVRLGNWNGKVWFIGHGIGAKVRL